jgi:GT2 family glycosyltransferase
MAKEKEKIAVIILNWNQTDLTLACLKSVFQSRTEGQIEIEAIVIDNGSTDDSKKRLKEIQEKRNLSRQGQGEIEILRSKFPNFKVIFNKENLGFAGGNNVGLRYALENKADFIFILNNDTEIKNDCILNLWQTFLEEEKIGIASPKIYYAPGFEFHKERYQEKDLGRVIWYAGGKIDWDNVLGRHLGVDEVDQGQYEKKEENEFATGCAFMAKRAVFEDVGLFDERFCLYLEDLDFSYRVAKAGFKLVFNPQAVVWHKNAGSSSAGSALQTYYFTRNRLLFAQKHAPLKLKLLVYRQALEKLRQGSKIEKEAVRDFFKRRFGFQEIDKTEEND